MARRRVRSGHKKYYDLYKKEKRGRRIAAITGATLATAPVVHSAVSPIYKLSKIARHIGSGLNRIAGGPGSRFIRIKAAGDTMKAFAGGFKGAGRTSGLKAVGGLGLIAGAGAAAGYGGYRLGKYIQGKMQGKGDVVYVYSRRLGRKIPISREKYESWKKAHGGTQQGAKQNV